MSEPIELLAPAGDLEKGKAAILCGADAVYMGATAFGARVNAGNSLEDIGELVHFAHVFGARVYATINTLLRDNEMDQAVSLIHQLWGIGVDAVIIQDVGLLQCELPPIPIFASTQMHNASMEKVQFLEAVGFSRVILARELSLEQIREIRSKTSVPIETFVHGALCVCYSGQCYLSHQIGGRSGNRGQCAQPCRNLWNLEDDEGNVLVREKHLLSLKDFNASHQVGALLDSGVTSFKIEGRLKDKNYVRNVVSHYRHQLDLEIEKRGLIRASHGVSKTGFEADLSKVFNRGFSSYFLESERKSLAQFYTPKSLGQFVGRVVSTDGKSLIIESNLQLENGDGLLLQGEGRVVGLRANRIEGNKVFLLEKAKIKPGMVVYRNHSQAFSKEMKSSIDERKLQVSISVTIEDSEMVFTAKDFSSGSTVEHRSERTELGRNQEATKKAYKEQLVKSGGTMFQVIEVQLPESDLDFIPKGKLNEIRRALFEKLEKLRLSIYEQITVVRKNSSAVYPEKAFGFEGNVLNKYAKQFYKKHGCEVLEPAAESGLDLKGRRVMTTKYCIRGEMGACLIKKDEAKNLPRTLFLADQAENRYSLRFDCKDCHMELWAG